MAAVIRVSELSKRYWLQHETRARYRSLREDLTNWVATPFRAAARKLGRNDQAGAPASGPEEFWALRDVTFDVEQGEVVGIVGSNGAGKSTLLKILSRITEPTSGRIDIGGRVASLLEVGTGFHPELTGRENIYLNGAILGMSRTEIRAKFDEIVAFAEVERFLDTPVKRYSSGMYVRLAFAVAAHLEPEILIVDEVLAVGDAQFQKKCLGKMQDVSAREGRTVLFVSHQLGTIRQLCNRAILLSSGRIAATGSANDVIDAYLGDRKGGFEANAGLTVKEIAVQRAWTAKAGQGAAASFVHTDTIEVNVQCRVNRWVPNAELRLLVTDGKNRRVFTSDTSLKAPPDADHRVISAQAAIPPHFLRPETYQVGLYLFVHNQVILDSVNDALTFTIRDGGSKYAASEGVDYGCVFDQCRWVVSYESTQVDVAAS